MLQTIDTVDKTVIVWIHNNHNHIMDYLMPIITDADNWVLPILALILYLGIKCGKRGKITLVLLIFALALTDSICAQLLKPFFERIRPSHIGLDGLNLLVSKVVNGVCHQIMLLIFFHLQLFYLISMKNIKGHYLF